MSKLTELKKELKSEWNFIKAGAKSDLQRAEMRLSNYESWQDFKLTSSIVLRQLFENKLYLQQRREFRETFGDSRKASNELFSLFFINLLAEYWDKINKPKLPSLILDGPVRSGTSTQAELWQKYFDFESLQMGMMFRAIAAVSQENGLTAPEVIQLTKEGYIHFCIRFQDDQPAFEVSCTHPDHQFLQVIEKSRFGTLRTSEIDKYASSLNSDPERVVEKLVVTAVNMYLEKNNGVVMEGRNLASIIPSFSLRAFYLAVSDDEAKRREVESVKRQSKKNGKPQPSDEELARLAQKVVERNASDIHNGILLTPDDAFQSEKYTAIYLTDMAGPYYLFNSMVNVHDIIRLDDLFIPNMFAYLRLVLFTGYSELPSNSLMHFSRRRDRQPGNRALA